MPVLSATAVCDGASLEERDGGARLGLDDHARQGACSGSSWTAPTTSESGLSEVLAFRSESGNPKVGRADAIVRDQVGAGEIATALRSDAQSGADGPDVGAVDNPVAVDVADQREVDRVRGSGDSAGNRERELPGLSDAIRQPAPAADSRPTFPSLVAAMGAPIESGAPPSPVATSSSSTFPALGIVKSLFET